MADCWILGQEVWVLSFYAIGDETKQITIRIFVSEEAANVASRQYPSSRYSTFIQRVRVEENPSDPVAYTIRRR